MHIFKRTYKRNKGTVASFFNLKGVENTALEVYFSLSLDSLLPFFGRELIGKARKPVFVQIILLNEVTHQISYYLFLLKK